MRVIPTCGGVAHSTQPVSVHESLKLRGLFRFLHVLVMGGVSCVLNEFSIDTFFTGLPMICEIYK